MKYTIIAILLVINLSVLFLCPVKIKTDYQSCKLVYDPDSLVELCLEKEKQQTLEKGLELSKIKCISNYDVRELWIRKVVYPFFREKIKDVCRVNEGAKIMCELPSDIIILHEFPEEDYKKICYLLLDDLGYQRVSDYINIERQELVLYLLLQQKNMDPGEVALLKQYKIKLSKKNVQRYECNPFYLAFSANSVWGLRYFLELGLATGKKFRQHCSCSFVFCEHLLSLGELIRYEVLSDDETIRKLYWKLFYT